MVFPMPTDDGHLTCYILRTCNASRFTLHETCPPPADTIHASRDLSTSGGYEIRSTRLVRLRRIRFTLHETCPPPADTLHETCPSPTDTIHAVILSSVSTVRCPADCILLSYFLLLTSYLLTIMQNKPNLVRRRRIANERN